MRKLLNTQSNPIIPCHTNLTSYLIMSLPNLTPEFGEPKSSFLSWFWYSFLCCFIQKKLIAINLISLTSQIWLNKVPSKSKILTVVAMLLYVTKVSGWQNTENRIYSFNYWIISFHLMEKFRQVSWSDKLHSWLCVIPGGPGDITDMTQKNCLK